MVESVRKKTTKADDKNKTKKATRATKTKKEKETSVTKVSKKSLPEEKQKEKKSNIKRETIRKKSISKKKIETSAKKQISATAFTAPYPEINVGEQLFIPQVENHAADDKLKNQAEKYKKIAFYRTYRGWAFYLTFFIMMMTLLFAYLSGDMDILFGLAFIIPILYLIYKSYRTSYVIAIIWWSLEKLIQLTEVSSGAAAGSIILWWLVICYVYFRAYRVEDIRLKEKKAQKENVSYKALFRDIILSVVLFFAITFGVAFLAI